MDTHRPVIAGGGCDAGERTLPAVQLLSVAPGDVGPFAPGVRHEADAVRALSIIETIYLHLPVLELEFGAETDIHKRIAGGRAREGYLKDVPAFNLAIAYCTSSGGYTGKQRRTEPQGWPRDHHTMDVGSNHVSCSIHASCPPIAGQAATGTCRRPGNPRLIPAIRNGICARAIHTGDRLSRLQAHRNANLRQIVIKVRIACRICPNLLATTSLTRTPARPLVPTPWGSFRAREKVDLS